MGFEPTWARFTAWRSTCVELRPQRRRQESNLRGFPTAIERGWELSSGGCSSAPDHSATSSKSKARRTGIEPVASRFGDGCSAIGTSGVCCKSAQGRIRTSVEPMGLSGLQPDAINRSATCASSNSQRGRVRTFDLVRPRHARCQTAPHAESRDEGGRMKE